MNLKYLKMIVAVAMLAIATALAIPAVALNVDQNKIVPTRTLNTNQTNYYRLTINFNDPNIASGQKFGRLPAASFINMISCHVTTAFNAVTTNVVTIGTTKANANEIVVGGGAATASITPGTATYQPLTTAAGLGLAVTASAEVDLYAKYTQTGTAATTGSVTCIIEFVPNNDL